MKSVMQKNLPQFNCARLKKESSIWFFPLKSIQKCLDFCKTVKMTKACSIASFSKNWFTAFKVLPCFSRLSEPKMRKNQSLEYKKVSIFFSFFKSFFTAGQPMCNISRWQPTLKSQKPTSQKGNRKRDSLETIFAKPRDVADTSLAHIKVVWADNGAEACTVAAEDKTIKKGSLSAAATAFNFGREIPAVCIQQPLEEPVLWQLSRTISLLLFMLPLPTEIHRSEWTPGRAGQIPM